MTNSIDPNDRYKHKHSITLYLNGEQLDMLNAFTDKYEVTRSAVLRAMLSTLKIAQTHPTHRARIKELINLINQEKVDILEGTLGIKVTNISSQALTTWRQQPND